jgi:C-terminal processing protease CtpA/Prc
LESFVDINNLLIKAFRIAEEKHTWTIAASYQADQAQAIYRERLKENPLASFFTFLRAETNWEFRSRCPDELLTVLNLVKSKAGFDFGVINYTDVDPRSFTVVVKGLVAAKLGFRSGDMIQSIDGKDVDDIEQLKMQIKRLKGKTAKAVVKRDGKSETLDLTIPEDFTSKKDSI